jgi:hypothetical protein
MQGYASWTYDLFASVRRQTRQKLKLMPITCFKPLPVPIPGISRELRRGLFVMRLSCRYACNRFYQSMQIHRLGKVLLETRRKRFCPVFPPGKRGEGNGGRAAAVIRRQISHFTDELISIHLRHANVADNHIRLVRLYLFQSFGSSRCRNYLGKIIGQYQFSDRQDIGRIIHD